MSPKAAPKAAKPPAAKKEAKAPAPKEAKKPAKGAKAAAKDDDAELEAAPQVSMDEQEEMEDQAEEAAAKSSGGGSDDAALAAAASTGEMSASFKNFRHHPDMENFYRFIYENDLRHEALVIIDEMAVQKLAKKTAPKGGKSASH
jgi:hypothetical protein